MKLSNIIIRQIFELVNSKNEKNLISSKMVSFLLHCGQFADVFGRIRGLYYKDVAEAIGVEPNYFYILRDRLEELGIIEVCSSNTDKNTWSFTIKDNIFLTNEDYKKGYLNLNYEILHTKEFHDLGLTEKLIVIKLLCGMNNYSKDVLAEHRRSIRKQLSARVEHLKAKGDAKSRAEIAKIRKEIVKECYTFSNGVSITYKTIAKWANITAETARLAVKKLSSIMNITINKAGAFFGFYAAEKNQLSLANRREQKEKEVYVKHLVRFVLRQMGKLWNTTAETIQSISSAVGILAKKQNTINAELIRMLLESPEVDLLGQISPKFLFSLVNKSCL